MCEAQLLARHSRANCTSQTSYGCTLRTTGLSGAATSHLWVSGGCRGRFACDGVQLLCGRAGDSAKTNYCNCTAGAPNTFDTDGCQWARAYTSGLEWTMCTYASSSDRWISRSIQDFGAWEPLLVGHVLATLRAHAGSRLLDLGGNIGIYALAAAAAGHGVDVWEPMPQSARMLLRSAQVNGFADRLTLYPIAAGNRSDCEHTSSLRIGPAALICYTLYGEPDLPFYHHLITSLFHAFAGGSTRLYRMGHGGGAAASNQGALTIQGHAQRSRAGNINEDHPVVAIPVLAVDAVTVPPGS